MTTEQKTPPSALLPEDAEAAVKEYERQVVEGATIPAAAVPPRKNVKRKFTAQGSFDRPGNVQGAVASSAYATGPKKSGFLDEIKRAVGEAESGFLAGIKEGHEEAQRINEAKKAKATTANIPSEVTIESASEPMKTRMPYGKGDIYKQYELGDPRGWSIPPLRGVRQRSNGSRFIGDINPGKLYVILYDDVSANYIVMNKNTGFVTYVGNYNTAYAAFRRLEGYSGGAQSYRPSRYQEPEYSEIWY
jgi:hypothetical protein